MGSSPLTETLAPDDPAAPLAALLRAGTEVAARYEVRSVLGSGGSAVVYEARDRELGQDVALKVLRADRLTPAALRRFRREVAVTRRIASPRLVRVFDLGESDGLLYLTMELVRGESLAQRLRRERLGVEDAVRIAAEVLEGLGALHAQGVVHRDVKPGNILLDGAGSARLADFGLAREMVVGEGRVTESEALVGTLHYLSPEQALGRELDVRSDLYSLGLVLYEMLAGRLAFERPSAVGALLARLTDRPADLRGLRPDVPGWLVETVELLLARDRARRPATALEVLEALRRRRAPGVRRLGKGARLVAWALAAVVGVSAVSAAGRVLWASRFARVESAQGKGLWAIDNAGRILWSRADVEGPHCVATVRLGRGERSVVTIASSTADGSDPAESRRLLFLDPQSGRVTRTGALVSGASLFPGFADRYLVRPLLAVDFDGDGRDEVVASYHHVPYWPSYTVLFEPDSGRSMPVFAGSGHHKVVGATDLDGDGRREILVAGINNRMGWYGAVAAVRAPRIPSDFGADLGTHLAQSPDEQRFMPRQDPLAWYALCPPLASRAALEDVRVDERLRRIRVPFVDSGASPILLGFDGFSTVGSTRPLPPSVDRERTRHAAYQALRAATRLTEGFEASSVDEARRAVEEARRAADAVLEEWASRVLARCLTRAGGLAESDQVLARILVSPIAAPREVCFGAALDRHLTGRLEEAVGWYRRGIGDGGDAGGRDRGELLGGLVLALVEGGRYDDARAAIARFRSAYSSELSLSPVNGTVRYEEYVTLRQKGRVVPVPLSEADATDLRRHWVLEFEASSGGDPRALLARTRAEKGRASGSPGLLLSLESKLLVQLGRSDEAIDVGRQAFEQVFRAAPTDITARGMLELVAGRLADLLHRGGFAEEARRVRERAASALRPIEGTLGGSPRA